MNCILLWELLLRRSVVIGGPLGSVTVTVPVPVLLPFNYSVPGIPLPVVAPVNVTVPLVALPLPVIQNVSFPYAHPYLLF